MPRKKQPKIRKSVRVIPEYRQEVDVQKMCKALILAAKNLAREKDAAKPEN